MPRYFFDINDGQMIDSAIGCAIDVDVAVQRLNDFEDRFGSSNGSRTLEEVEMAYIVHVLKKHDGRKPAAAKELGIALKTLYNKLDRMEVVRSL